MENLNEKCAVFGVYSRNLDVARLAFFGLFALQHRGQESSGIATGDGKKITGYKNAGLVAQVYSEDHIANLKGHMAIGHNRYSTSAGTGLGHAQPIVIDPVTDTPIGKVGVWTNNGLLALAHNGNLPSVKALSDFLKDKHVSTIGMSDSELMAEAIGYYLKQGNNLKSAVKKSFPLFTGAFSLLVMNATELVAVRDHCGIRPLSLGKLNGNPEDPGGYVFASETCAFHTIGAQFIREINPGEMVSVNQHGLEAEQLAAANLKTDIFEFVYFARPDSHILGKSVYQVRKNCGIKLAEEFPVKADIIVPVPETAIPVATGYAAASGIPLEMALVKNRYIHRTFIQPDQHSRDLGVKLKLTPLPEVIKGKKIVVMDDSIVRGTTSRQLVRMLFEAGAAEVHMLISSPPVKFPDFYGIDTPKQEKLIASHKTVEEIRQFLGATSLYFLSLKGLVESTGLPEDVFCMSCFNGVYPIDIHERKTDIKEPLYTGQDKPPGAMF